MHPPLFAIMDEIQEGLRYMFQTKSKYVLLISGTGHAGKLPSISLQALSNGSLWLADCPEDRSGAQCNRLMVAMALAGMEAAIANLLEPDETIVVGNNGIWGTRVAEMAGRFRGAEVPMKIQMRASLSQHRACMEMPSCHTRLMASCTCKLLHGPMHVVCLLTSMPVRCRQSVCMHVSVQVCRNGPAQVHM